MTPARILVRLPVGLHAELVAEAKRQGVSVNALVVALLAGGISWSGERDAKLARAAYQAGLAREDFSPKEWARNGQQTLTDNWTPISPLADSWVSGGNTKRLPRTHLAQNGRTLCGLNVGSGWMVSLWSWQEDPAKCRRCEARSRLVPLSVSRDR